MTRTQTVSALNEEFVEVNFRHDPVAASGVGIHDYDHLLPDDSPDGITERRAWLDDFERRLTALPGDDLPTAQRVDLALLGARIEGFRLEYERMRAHERNPVRYPETALNGVFVLFARPFAPLEERKEPIVQRLLAIPDYLATARQNLRDVPEVYVGIASEIALTGPAFIDEVVRTLRRHFPGESERIEHAGGRARLGFLQYQDFLEKTLAPAAGACAVGADVFNRRLQHEHLLDLDAQSAEAIGREHMAKAHEALEAEAKRLDATRDWREQILEAKRRTPEAGRLREAYVAETERARSFVERMRIAPIPQGRLDVIDTPAYKRLVIPYAAYLPPGPFDDDQTGALYVTPVDATRPEAAEQLGAHCLAHLPIIALHEGYPGRHLQRLHANNAPSRVRQLNDSPLFYEGWAVYCEEMMQEQGYFDDPVTRLFQLRDLLWRACGVVVDVRLHTGVMSPSQARAFLIEEALLEPLNADREVKRHCLEPAKPLCYLIGKLELLEIRAEVERALGSRFDLHDFHSALLAGGTLQPSLVREEVGERLGIPQI
jgi:hypothetical protein